MDEQSEMESENSSPSSRDYRNELADKIALALNDPDAKPIILGMMAEYKIDRIETGLIAYNGGETDYLMARFLVAKRVQGCTERTIKTYRQQLDYAFRQMCKSPSTVTHIDIQAMLARMIMRGNSKAYQCLMHRTLSSFYAWAAREEIILKNPMNKVSSVKLKPPKKKAFSELEVEKIRNCCQTRRETALVEVLFSTGCRAFEVAALTIDQVQNEAVEIVGKGEKPRTVYLTARAQVAINNYLHERQDSNPYLFPASVLAGTNVVNSCGEFGRVFNGKPDWYIHPEKVSAEDHIQSDALRSIVHRIGERAGVTDCHPHRFRRTCATLALKRGMPVTMVQLMLGHDSLATTQRYLDIQESELLDAHRKFVI